MKKRKSTTEHVSSQRKGETVTGIAWKMPMETTCVMATKSLDVLLQRL